MDLAKAVRDPWVWGQYFKAKARAEERWLMERFPGYQAYLRHVPRQVL